MFEGLCDRLHEDDISDIGKCESNTYSVTVTTSEAADLLNMYGQIKVRDRTYQVISISKQNFEFRVHWLPSYIKDTFLEDFFSRLGKVISVIREALAFGPNATKRTSVPRIMIETDDLKKRSLPYVIAFTGGYTALITVPGRPLRKDCNPQGTSYASRARGGGSGEALGTSADDVNGGGDSNDTSSTDGATGIDTATGGDAAMGGDAARKFGLDLVRVCLFVFVDYALQWLV